jgi:hypothetical protein
MGQTKKNLPRARTILGALILSVATFVGVASSQGNDPKPQDATEAILAAFDKYEIVGVEAAHGFKDLDDYILSLIGNPEFPAKVNDIVVECGNRLYQRVLDRYIAGEDVPLADVQPVWRNTTALMCSVSAFYENLFPLVRRINQMLPLQKRLRVVAADPPIDWAKVKDRQDYVAIEKRRTSSITSVIVTEVLARKRRALLLFGWSHLTHMGARSSVRMYEKSYPRRPLVILPHVGFGSYNSLDIHNAKLESRMKTWATPSLVPIKGTWLAELDLTYYMEEIPGWGVGLEIGNP